MHSDTANQNVPFDAARRELGVVVGFDGSEQALLALHYGARAALRRTTVLTVVTAMSPDTQYYATLAAMPSEAELNAKHEAAQATLAKAREYLQDYQGEVAYRIEKGDAAGILVDLSSEALLTVIGARGRGGFLGRILGSVAAALPAHAHCPTVVVPRDYDTGEADDAQRFEPVVDGSPITVGIDGSPQSRIAALQAAEVASERGTGLQLLMGLPPFDGWHTWYPGIAVEGYDIVERRKAELEIHLRAEGEWLRGYFPELTVDVTVSAGEAAKLLAEASASSQLTVVGTHGRGNVGAALLGSISRGVLNHAKGPIMVVPKLHDARLEDQPAGAI